MGSRAYELLSLVEAETFFFGLVPIDGGATYSHVSRPFSNHLGRDVGRLFRPMVVRVADNRTL